MVDFEALKSRRLTNWCQDGQHSVPDPKAAAEFIDSAGVVTVYPASPEFPNLLHAYTSDPNTKATADWDSSSGEVYTWRWKLGQANAGFYGLVVVKRPTFVSWNLLPAILALLFERRTPDELFDQGLLSPNALRVAKAFEDTDGTLPTKELRNRAGFPTGKANRAAYGKAVEELEQKLMLAKTFRGAEDEEFMCHAWVEMSYEHLVREALALSREAALDKVIQTYIAQAVYLEPKVLAKHLRIPETEVEQSARRLVEASIFEAAEGLYFTKEEK